MIRGHFIQLGCFFELSDSKSLAMGRYVDRAVNKSNTFSGSRQFSRSARGGQRYHSLKKLNNVGYVFSHL